MRQPKRRTSRSPAVWRGIQPTPAEDSIQHGIREQFGFSWRTFSGIAVVILSLLLLMFFITPFFYVRSVTVIGAQYLDAAEVFRYAGIAEMHIFWVNPDEVRQNILAASPVVADAQVRIGWPPDMVKITIEEREPALLLTQANVRVLVDVQGNVLRAPRDTETFPDLIHVVADNSVTDPPLPGKPIPLDVVAGALQLRSLISGLPSLRYNAVNGLGFQEETWDVWLGTGTDMPNKLLIYEALRDNLLSRGITPVSINVADLDAVYFCWSLEFCE
ncbi:MAG: hypothetical protein Kow00117_04750 [Phototrophicales bacterium]